MPQPKPNPSPYPAQPSSPEPRGQITEVGKDPVRDYPAQAETPGTESTAEIYGHKPGEQPGSEGYTEEVPLDYTHEYDNPDAVVEQVIGIGVALFVVFVFFMIVRGIIKSINQSKGVSVTPKPKTISASHNTNRLAEILARMEQQANAGQSPKPVQLAPDVNANTRDAILHDQQYSLSRKADATRDLDRWLRSAEDAPGVEQTARSVEQTARPAERGWENLADNSVDYDYDERIHSHHSLLTDSDHTFQRSQGRSKLAKRPNRAKQLLQHRSSLRNAFIASLVIENPNR